MGKMMDSPGSNPEKRMVSKVNRVEKEKGPSVRSNKNGHQVGVEGEWVGVRSQNPQQWGDVTSTGKKNGSRDSIGASGGGPFGNSRSGKKRPVRGAKGEKGRRSRRKSLRVDREGPGVKSTRRQKVLLTVKEKKGEKSVVPYASASRGDNRKEFGRAKRAGTRETRSE